MQHSLETEAKAKAEALRMKKKLESDINDLEAALGQSSKANAELQRLMTRLEQEKKEQFIQYENEQRLAMDLRKQLTASDRQANNLQNDLDESRTLLDQAERGRRNAESDLSDVNNRYGKLNTENTNLVALRRKMESDYHTLQVSRIGINNNLV